ncbi:DUF2961 domain-containing protein [bacterium]|nr:DUF2961 domain-containing protein [bacterium]MBU1983171.1 DUF2961 domain-containing protein [bacterium]
MRIGVLLAMLLPAVSFGQPADFWQYLLYREWLADTIPAEVLHFSSYDRERANDDYGEFYGTDSSGYGIMCDVEGPGVVTHFWLTRRTVSDASRWKIYVDNLEVPTVDTTIRALFGHAEPFTPPLADSMFYGRYSYVPIPFQNRLRMTIYPGASYYHVNVLRFPPGTTVEAFQMPPTAAYMESLDSLRTVFNNRTQPALSGEPVLVVHNTVELPAGVTDTLIAHAEPGFCRKLLLTVDSHTEAAHDGLQIRVFADHHPLPLMEGPISSLFGAPRGLRNYQSAITGALGDTLYLNLPIPFAANLTVLVTNGTDSTRTIQGEAEIVDREPDQIPPLRLFGIHREAWPTRMFEPYECFDIAGPGTYVGLFWQMTGTTHSVLEGDENLYFDREREASWLGTGTEDYFNGGYFWSNANGQVTPYQLSMHGVLYLGGGNCSAYRWHLADPVPFTSRLRMTLEVGGFAQYAGNYRTTAFIYAPIPRWVVKDQSGDGSIYQGEPVRIIGHGLPAGSVADAFLGDWPMRFLTDSLISEAGICDITVFSSSHDDGVSPILIRVNGVVDTVADAWPHTSQGHFVFRPRRMDIDTLVFAGDTLDVEIHGITPGIVPELMAGERILQWAGPDSTADSLARIQESVILPQGMPSGDWLVEASVEGEIVARCDQILRSRRYLRLEAEDLRVASWRGTNLWQRGMLAFTHPDTSFPWGRQVALYLGGAQEGDSLNLAFQFGDSGQFLPAYFFAATGGGAVVTVSLDGDTDVVAMDTYRTGLGWRCARTDTVYGLWRDIEPGEHILTFKVTGRNPSSTGWDIWIDQILIIEEFPSAIPHASSPARPERFALDPVFPNPFNSTASLRLWVPEAGRVKVRVFNLLGREVAVLADERMEAGERFLRWDAGGLASGIYFVRLEAPREIIIRKALLLR